MAPKLQGNGHTRLATSICRLRHDQMEQGPTEPQAGCSTFLLSSGGAGGGYYRVAFGTGPIAAEHRYPCQTLLACLGHTVHTLRTQGGQGVGKHMRCSPHMGLKAGKDRLKAAMCPRWGSDLASGHYGAQKLPLGRASPPPVWGVHLHAPGGYCTCRYC